MTARTATRAGQPHAEGKARPGEAPLDTWSLAHVGAGLALGLAGVSWWLAAALIVGFEGVEAVLRKVKRGGNGLFQHESFANVAADVVLGLGGWAAGVLLLDVLGWPRLVPI